MKMENKIFVQRKKTYKNYFYLVFNVCLFSILLFDTADVSALTSKVGRGECSVYSCKGTTGCGGGYALDVSSGQAIWCSSTWSFTGVARSGTVGTAHCVETYHPSGDFWGCDSWIFTGVATDGPTFCTSGVRNYEVYSPRTGGLIAFNCNDNSASNICSGHTIANRTYSSVTGKEISFDCVKDVVGPEPNPSYSCTGSIPNNSNLCSGDSSGLTANTTRTLQSSCTSNRKCEYTCRSGYHKSGTQCVKNSAVVPEVFHCRNYGDPIVHATICPGADLNITAPLTVSTVNYCDWEKCTYLCDPGYISNAFNNNCIPSSLPRPPEFSCFGSIPSNSNLCSGDSSGLTANAARTLQSSCTSNRKCEYTCKSGYHRRGNSCVRGAVNYSCTGSIPSNSNLCSGDSSGLTANTVRTLQSSCTSNRKCEYTCRSGYNKSGTRCVKNFVVFPEVFNCLNYGDPIVHATICPGADSNVASPTVERTVDSCNDWQKCTYLCDPGYVPNLFGNNCILSSSPSLPVDLGSCTGSIPSNSNLCFGDSSGLAEITTRTLQSSCTSNRKCEYTCNFGYHKSGTSCVKDSVVCTCSNTEAHCLGATFADSCGNVNCLGTLVCPTNYLDTDSIVYSCWAGNISRKTTPRYSYECLNGNCNETITYIPSNEFCGSRTCEDDGQEVEFCDGNATNTKKVGVKDSCTNSGCEQPTETCAVGQPQDCEVGEVCRMNAGHAECVSKTFRWIEE